MTEAHEESKLSSRRYKAGTDNDNLANRCLMAEIMQGLKE